MTMVDDQDAEIEIEIPADEVAGDKAPAPAAVEADVGKEKSADAPKPTDDENVAELRAQLDRHKRAAEAAERARAEEARRHQADMHAARADAADTTLRRVEGGIELEKTKIAEAKRVLKESGELQDWARFADAQVELNQAQIRLTAYEGYAQQLQQAKPEARKPAEGRVQPAQQERQEQADPVETFAQQLKPNSAAWIRAHPELVTDDELRHDMVAGHYKALKAGLVEDSPEYIAFLDQRMFPKGAAADPGPGANMTTIAATAPPKRPPSATMVAKTAAPGGGEASPKTYKLTAAQVAICEQMGWDKKTYAKNAYAIEQEKKARKA